VEITLASIRKGATIVVLASCVLATAAFTDELHPYREAASVCVQLTTKDYLSGPALKT
jgi:hypothetical protein